MRNSFSWGGNFLSKLFDKFVDYVEIVLAWAKTFLFFIYEFFAHRALERAVSKSYPESSLNFNEISVIDYVVHGVLLRGL